MYKINQSIHISLTSITYLFMLNHPYPCAAIKEFFFIYMYVGFPKHIGDKAIWSNTTTTALYVTPTYETTHEGSVKQVLWSISMCRRYFSSIIIFRNFRSNDTFDHPAFSAIAHNHQSCSVILHTVCGTYWWYYISCNIIWNFRWPE